MKLAYVLLFTMVLGFGGSTIQTLSQYIVDFQLPRSQYGTVGSLFEPSSVVFGGDIMLGRSVEDIMAENGPSFPFMGITTLITDHDLAIANFEATVPEVHQKTMPNTVRFSVPESALREVALSGFDVLSLSNNHALDHGEEGFAHTKEACTRSSVLCVGHPTRLDGESLAVVTSKNTRIGILTLHTLFEQPSTSTLTTLIESLGTMSDVQFAFIHWGEEYAPVHNEAQEMLAHFLIDHGIDAVIGHHPHVQQDIELYAEKPIFYSLGNLIFDQYFRRDVQEGYMVSVLIANDTLRYTIVPYDMHDEPSQPRIQFGEEREAALWKLLQNSQFNDEQRKTGTIEVSR